MLRVTKAVIVGMLFIATSSLAVAKAPRKEPSDTEKLQGTWLADLEPGVQGRLRFQGSQLRYVHVSKDRETLIWDGHFAVNEQANPKQMDWTPLRQSNRKVASSLAIYHLEGDLLLIIGSTEAARPTAFYSGGGEDRPKTVIFRRAPAEEKDSATDSE